MSVGVKWLTISDSSTNIFVSKTELCSHPGKSLLFSDLSVDPRAVGNNLGMKAGDARATAGVEDVPVPLGQSVTSGEGDR